MALALLALGGCGLEREASGSSSEVPPGETPAVDLDGGVVGKPPPGTGIVTLPDGGGSTPVVPETDAAPPVPPVEPNEPGSCNQTGKFAMRLQSQVRWAGTTLFDIVPIITQGSGALTVYVMADMVANGNDRTTTLRACGTNIPDFSSSVLETYGVVTPAEVWEKVKTTWTTSFKPSCNQPGCSYSADPVIAQLGIGIPTTAPWPSARDPLDVATLRDEDGDSVPGILLRARGPKDPGFVNYSHPPTNYLLTERISELWLALRLRAEMQGVIDSCDTFIGNLPATTLDTRALACRLESGLRCDENELSFIDDNLPVWKVDSAAMRAVRLPSNATCADVLSAPY